MGRNFHRKTKRSSFFLCFVLAGIYTAMAITMPSLLSMGVMLGVLGIMFVVLYRSPKHIPYILGKDHGIPKPVFVILCVGLAFVLFALLIALFPVSEPTQNSVESGDRASESFSTSSSIVEESTPEKRVKRPTVKIILFREIVELRLLEK